MKNITLYILAFISLSASAFEEFLITDIRIIGLQRVSIGSIFTAIPVSVGDKMSQSKVREISKALFATALGLLAAIPAVIAYNKFNNDSKKYSQKLENFSKRFISII